MKDAQQQQQQQQRAASSPVTDCFQSHQAAQSDRQTFKQTVGQTEETPEDPQTPQRHREVTPRKIPTVRSLLPMQAWVE